MNKTKAVVALCMEEFGNNSIETLQERILIQKKFYLLQTNGAKLGFNYGWYKRGPYCTELTKVVYNQKEDPEDISGCSLSDSVKVLINKVNTFIMSTKIEGLNEQEWAELLASLHYLHNNFIGMDIDDNKKKLLVELRHEKPWYKEEQVKKAIECLYKEYDFVS